MASRDPKHLHPDLEPLFHRHLEIARSLGIDLLLTDGYRSHEEQEILYQSGRTMPGSIRTYKRGGESAHNMRLPSGAPAACAYDVAFVEERNASGKAVKVSWTGPWNTVAGIGMALGLEWGGLWQMRDRPHFQLPNWESRR